MFGKRITQGPQFTTGQASALHDRTMYGQEHVDQFAAIAVAESNWSWYSSGYWNIANKEK